MGKHKSKYTTEKFLPIIRAALQSYPDILKIRPRGLAVATVVGRLRDSLRYVAYEDSSLLDPSQAIRLRELMDARDLVVTTHGGSPVIGSRNSIKQLRNPGRQEKLTDVEPVQISPEVDKPTAEVIHAFATLIRHGHCAMVGFSGVKLSLVEDIVGDLCSVSEMPDGDGTKIFLM